MKSILIERVNNGWIVRPFSPCEIWAKGDCVDMWVYNTIDDIQAALPRLLEALALPEQPKPQPQSNPFAPRITKECIHDYSEDESPGAK